MAGTLILDTIKSSTTSPPAIQNTSGVASYLARAWVNFNGSGTVAIRASGNVSSITDNAVGDYTVNFTTAMPDANYSLVGVSRTQTANNAPSIFSPFVSNTGGTSFTHVAPTTSAARVVSGFGNAGGTWDSDYIMVSVFS